MKERSKTKSELISELKRLQKRTARLVRTGRALRESESRYRSLFENSLDAILLTAPDGSIFSANPAACRMYGRTEEEICRIGRNGLVDSHDPRLAPLLEETQLMGKAMRELIQIRSDGTRFPTEVSSSTYETVEGAKTSMIVRDITEWKRAEESLKNMAKFSEENPNPVLRIGGGGNVLYANRAAGLLLQSLGGAVGGPAPPLWHDWVIQVLASQAAKATEVEHDARIYSFDLIPITERGYVNVYARDITKRKLAEAELATTQQRYRELFDNIVIGLLRSTPGPKGAFIDVNLAMVEMFEADNREQLMALHPSEIYLDPSQRRIISDVVMSKGFIKGEEVRFRTLRGRPIWGRITAVKKIDASGQIYFDNTIEDITERKQVEEVLKESETRYRQLFENINSGVAVYEVKDGGRDFIFKDFNHAGEKIDNDKREKLVGRSIFEVRPGVKEFGLLDVFKRVWMTGNPEHFPIRMYKDNRLSGWYDNFVYKLPSGEIVSVFENVTERKWAEEALRLEKENFRRSLDESPLGMRIVTADGDTLYANRAILDFYGYDSLEELRKTPLRARYTPESYAEFRKRKQQRERGDFSTSEYEISIVRKNGEVLHLQVHRKNVLWNNAQQFLVIYQDITERKKAEEAVALLGHTIRSIGECISITDTDNKILFVNEAFLRKYGYTADELIGKSITVVRSPRSESAAEKVLSTTLKDGWQGELVNRKKDGTEFPIALSTSVVRNEKGEPIALVGIAVDITERKRTEVELSSTHSQLRQLSHRLLQIHENERRAIARELHDEIGQILTATKIDLEVIRRNESSNDLALRLDDGIAMLDECLQEVRNLSLDLRPSILDDLGLVAALRWQLERLEHHVGFQGRLIAEGIQERFDPDLETACFRIAQESLTNIAKHAKAHHVEIELKLCDHEIDLSIRDDGVGFDVDRALTETTHGKSFGILGMQERVALLGGKLEIKSAAGMGTIVTVRLPFRLAGGQ